MINLLQEKLLEPTKEWISFHFPNPVEVVKDLPTNDGSVIYICLSRSEENRVNDGSPFANIRIGKNHWDILYIGESGKFRNRYKQHWDKIETCKLHNLALIVKDYFFKSQSASIMDVDIEIILTFKLRLRKEL